MERHIRHVKKLGDIAYDARMIRSDRHGADEAHRLRAVLDTLNQGVVSVDPDRGVAYLNRSAADLLGLDADSVATAEFTTAMRGLFARALNQSVVSPLGGLLLGSSPARVECQLHFTEAPRRLQVTTQALGQNLSGGRLWVFDDVTAPAEALDSLESSNRLLRVSTERLAASEQKYRMLTENSTDAITHIRDGRFVWASPSIADILGAPPEYWVGREVHEIIPPDDEAGFAERMAILEAGGTVRRRIRLTAVDGATHWVDVHASPFFDDEGRRDGFTGTLRIVDHEVAVEAEVEEARRLQTASADSMLDPQVLFEAIRDADGCIVDFRYLRVNRACCLYLQVGEDELIGRSAVERLPNLGDSGLLDRYAQCLEDGQPVILTDFSFFHEILDDARRYDIRATRAGTDLLSLTWSDVTERYEAARRLARSEEQYRLLAENASDVIIHGRDGHVVWVSPSVEEVLGGSPAYWIGRPIKQVVPPDQEAAFDSRQDALAAGRAVQQRTQLVALDGTRHWIHVHSKPFYDRDGRPDGFTASLRLIDAEVATEQQAEQARRERARADELYRRSVDSAAVGMCLADLDGRISDANAALCQFTGYSADELQAKTWQELTAPDFLQADLEKRDQVLAGEIESYRMVKRFIHATGRLLWGDLSVGCVRGSDGRVETFIKQIIDITAEREAREQLEKARHREAIANELLRRSVDNAAIGMGLLDRTGHFIGVNPALCDFFGYDAEILKQKTWQELTGPDFLEADLSFAAAVLDGRLESYRMLKQYIHADGRLIWGDLSVSCVRDAHGLVEQFICQINDVTETVEANERSAALHQKLTQELHSAANYMSSIMPGGLTGEVTVSSRYIPSQQLGGDCFDYRWIDDDHLSVYLIDVSGHGIEPALLAVSLQNILRAGTFTNANVFDPTAMLTELNRLFQMDQHGDHFFTMWLGIYQKSTRTLRYASAGAPPAYALCSTAEQGGNPVELATYSHPVGVFDDTEFVTASYHVEPGCRILIYSDGASEIALPDGGQMEPDEFQELTARVARSPDWTLDDLIDELRASTPQGVFKDDLSLIRLSFD